MKRLLIILIAINSYYLNAQVDVSGGMGISFVNSSSLNQYLENNWASEDVNAFNSSAEFFLELNYSISPSFQLGIEDVYTLYSFNNTVGFMNYELEYRQHKPSLLAYYIMSGEGYKFKFGGGAGIRIVDLSEKKIITENYSTIGFGFLFRAQAHTRLGGNFYANVGSTMRFDFPGEPSNGDSKIYDNISNSYVNLTSFSVSVDLGVSYFF